MMLDLSAHFSETISDDNFFSWHVMLLPMQKHIHVGAYRTREDEMQIVSGRIDKPTVHFEAVPSRRVPKEMRQFIKWFNDSAPQCKNALPALARAAIAHLYFLAIHPFGDGNGRLARAISQKALMQAVNQPTFIVLSHIIQKNKKEYYAQLQKTNRTLMISEWVTYFAKTIIEAQSHTQQLVSFLVEKMHLYDRLRWRDYLKKDWMDLKGG
jgi:Fic family protein